MERVKAESLKGPRAYFTTFDPLLVSRLRDTASLRRNIERRLKVLLLTKSFVVCAASHLATDLAYGFFRDNPFLLEEGLVLPALRLDRTDIRDLFDTEKLSLPATQEMVNFYEREILKTVDWELQANSSWFRNSFLGELKNEHSVLRRNLAKVNQEQLRWIIEEVEKESILDTAKVDVLASRLDPDGREVLLNFRDLIYHMSGAKVVNCESALPQENYIDYSIADIKNRKVILSETQIFWKIFLELVFETMHKEMVSVELLDLLTFGDLLALRRPIEDTTFRENYDSLVRLSVKSVAQGDLQNAILTIEELLAIRDKLSNNFGEVFQKELPAFLKKKAVGNVKGLGKNTVSVGLGVAGFFPPFSLIASVASLAMGTPAFWMNLSQTFTSVRAINRYDKYQNTKEKALMDTIRKSDISDKSQLLDVVDMIVRTLSARLTL